MRSNRLHTREVIMSTYKAVNEVKGLSLVITEEKGLGHCLMVCPGGSDQANAIYLYYKLDDLFSVVQSRYEISKEYWTREK